MTVVISTTTQATVEVLQENNIVVVAPSAPAAIVETIGIGPQGPAGAGAPGNNDVGVIYLKANTTATTIPSVNGRAVVAGSMQTGELFNFIKDPSTNSLKYTGTGGKFHIIGTFNFYEGSQTTCGFYIGINRDENSALDPDADRISESEVYANASTPSNQPQAGALQTVQQLNPGDRVFFIVQNKDTAGAITVEFLKLICTSLTAEKGDDGPPRSVTVAGPVTGDNFTLFRADTDITLSSVTALVAGQSPSVTYEIRYALDRTDTGTLAIAPTTVTNTTTGAAATVQNQPIPADSYVWLDVTATAGTVGEINVSIAF